MQVYLCISLHVGFSFLFFLNKNFNQIKISPGVFEQRSQVQDGILGVVLCRVRCRTG